MTAIAGLLSFGEPVGSIESVDTMLQAMSHRGSLQASKVLQPGAWIGHCRHAAQQPIQLNGSRCIGFLHGVIHGGLNRPETPESLLRKFEEVGPAAFKSIAGEYAVAIWDIDRQQLTLARDPFGHRPLYYHVSDEQLTFATEIKALIASGLFKTELNRGRVADFIIPALEGINKSCTFYNELRRIPAGSAMIFSRAGMKEKAFWEPQRTPPMTGSNENFAEGFQQVFTEAVRSRSKNRSETVILLSGGLDSCAIAATASTLTNEQPHTYSLIAPTEDAPDCEETQSIHLAQSALSLHSRTFAPTEAVAGLPDISTLLSRLDNPFAANLLAGPIPLYHLAQKAGMRVAIDGLDGDVVTSLGGYFPWLVANEFGLREGLRALSDDYRHFGNSKELPRAFLGFLLRRTLHRLIPRSNRVRKRLRHRQAIKSWKQLISLSTINPTFAREVDVVDRLHEQWKNDHPYYPESVDDVVAQTLASPHLPTAIERYEEAASLFGLKSTHPFMDLRVIDFCLGLPWKQRVAKGVPKWILREAMRDKLPRQITNQYKIENIGAWFLNAYFSPYRQKNASPPKWLCDVLDAFIDIESLRASWQQWVLHPEEGISDEIENAILLGEWLRSHF